MLIFITLLSASFSIAIAYFWGKKRQIGFGWSLFFCIFLSPLIGFIITMLSRKYYDPNPIPSKSKRITGRTIIIISILSICGNIMTFNEVPPEKLQSKIGAITLGIALIGLGRYLIQLGRGRNFNTEALTNTDT